MFLIFDIHFETVGMMTHIDIEALVPNRIQLIRNKFGFEDTSRGELTRNVRICYVFPVNVEEDGVRIREIFGTVNVNVDPAMKKGELGLINLIFI